MTPAPVTVRDLTVRYGDQLALQDVDLQVEAGDFLGLVGPNGSGKTTLLRAMVGLVRPTRGTVRLWGTPVEGFDDLPRVGYVPQHAVHVDERFPASALEVVLMGRVARRGLLRRWSDDDRARARAALETVGVGELAPRHVGTLSGGQRQRVLLAKALAADPDLLLLDEPTAGVDPDAREDFYNLVDGLNHDQELTVVLVSHDVHALALCCHRMVALNQRVVFDGEPRAFDEAGGFSAVHDMEVHHHPDRAPEGGP